MRFSRRDLTKAALSTAVGLPILARLPGGAAAWAQDVEPAAPEGPLTGITMFGEPPLYPPDMAHWAYADPNAPVKDGDEVAFFPPVTGG